MNRIKITAILIILLSMAVQAQLPNTMKLLPVPSVVETQTGSLKITREFSIAVLTNTPDTIMLKAVNRMYQSLNRKTGLYFLKEYIGFDEKSDSATLIIRISKTVVPAPGLDESYSLSVTSGGAEIDASTTAGALHALQTLLQLCTKNGNEYYFPLVKIKDSPRYSWRGLMIDVSRHFIPMDVLERNIVAMEAVKMNVLHLHLSDDQGFRMESKVYPLLHKKGSNGDYYTQTRMKELVSFALDRGIIIVPEFDMPGHTTSWFAGYQEIASAPGPYKPGSPIDPESIIKKDLMSVMQLIQTAPFPAMDPSKESTYAFLDKFIKEMTTVFPSPYFHIGADEVNGVVWKKNPDIMAFMQKNGIADVHALQAYFVNRVHKIVKKNGRNMIGWEELFSKELSNDITVQVWQNPVFLNKALENGNPVLVSRGFYLDLFMPAYIHYNNADLKEGIRGGEAAIWTEAVDKNNIETRVWPRAASVAERLWSPNSVKDVDDMYRRLFIINRQLDDLGLQNNAAYERSLRLYANGEEYNSLKTLTDILTPVKGYKKLFARMMDSPETAYQTAPLIDISDIIFVDSEVRWRFRMAVKSYLQNKDAGSEKAIEYYLQLWQGNDKKLQQIFSGSAQLEKIREHSVNLTLVATIGSKAFEKIRAGETPSEIWINENLAVLKNAAKPHGETELDIITEIEALVRQKQIILPAAYSQF